MGTFSHRSHGGGGRHSENGVWGGSSSGTLPVCSPSTVRTPSAFREPGFLFLFPASSTFLSRPLRSSVSLWRVALAPWVTGARDFFQELISFGRGRCPPATTRQPWLPARWRLQGPEELAVSPTWVTQRPR